MPDVSMTLNALRRIARGRAAGDDVVNEILMTAQAVALKDFRSARFQQDRLVKILKRKALGVAKAVLRFGEIFRNKLVRQMTIDTSRDGVMRALCPRVVFVIHDVAVFARPGIGREVAQAFTVVKGEAADSRQSPKQHREEKCPFSQTHEGKL